LYLTLFCVVACSPVAAERPAGVTTIDSILVDGVLRSYRLHTPGIASAAPMPLVVSLHGFTASATRQETQSRMSELADREGFIVVYPEGLGTLAQGWQVRPDSEDVAFIRALVAHLQTRLNIDPTRIYATGLSNGGGMAARLACDAADVFAAIAPVSGAYAFFGECEPSRAIPIVIFHGLDDRVVPYTGSFSTPDLPAYAQDWAERNGCNTALNLETPHENVMLHRWVDCTDDVAVEFYTLEGTGHAWPGSSPRHNAVDASETMWAFFKRYTLSR
jgi:polyhydroxybutyrate depolymerase